MASTHQHKIFGLFVSSCRFDKHYLQNPLGVLIIVMSTVLMGCGDQFNSTPSSSQNQTTGVQTSASCKVKGESKSMLKAEVVALEQIITYNRFGAFNPAGMVYALRKDVVDEKNRNLAELSDAEMANLAGKVHLRDEKRPRPLVLRVHEDECIEVKFWNLLAHSPEIHSKLVRADFPEGGVQRHSVQTNIPDDISLTDLSTPPRKTISQTNPDDPKKHPLFPMPAQEEPDYPTTRAASIHVNGLDYININADGANVGNNPSSLVEPGKSTTYTWYARQEGGYFLYSNGALAGGEGDGGQLGLGLFGSINVEPKGSVWYRSQVTHAELTKAASGDSDYSNIAYDQLEIVKNDTIQHSDLNAIIYQTANTNETPEVCSKRSPGSSCGMSFREFTTIFHDENKVFQAFAELADEDNPISAIADGMAVNYGASGVGSAVLANMKHIGPGKDCPECKLEEFFLSSWVNGDPAMIVRRDMDGHAVKALYPDDPSNVHHSYLGDPVRFRNIHAGPKETHVFHLHAHQWLQDKNDPNANYLDSQTISPGSSYTYDIQYGGGGNRNLTVGDAIFHCHLYPHFAAGMWELWRNHDVFEDGKPSLYDAKTNPDPRARNLPDHEIVAGTPNPAIVPIPGYPLAPLPTAEMRGYPFFMAGESGHRPPQPPLDMAINPNATSPKDQWLDGGLSRHVIIAGTPHNFNLNDAEDTGRLLGGRGDKEATKASRYIAKRTWQLNSDKNNLVLAKELESATLKLLPQCGTQSEILAMAFHAGWNQKTLTAIKQDQKPENMLQSIWDLCKADFKAAISDGLQWNYNVQEAVWPSNRKIHEIPDDQKSPLVEMSPLWKGVGFETENVAYPQRYPPSPVSNPGKTYRVNGLPPALGAPFADPCPATYSESHTKANEKVVPVNRDTPRLYKSAYIQFDMTVNKYGWHDPQARMPVLEEDALETLNGTRLAEPLFFRANSGECIQFQATNLIPGVLNLDDFQVYTPTDTIGQHIHLVKFDVTSSDGSANGWNYEDGTFAPDEVRERIHASHNEKGGKVIDQFGKDVDKALWPKPKDYHLAKTDASDKRGTCSGNVDEDNKLHPWCGAQTTVQRWWADPVLNDAWDDRTMRAVFTHDHYGPSSHQQHGFYAALIVEPKNTVWTKLESAPDAINVSSINALGKCDSTLLGGSGLQNPCRSDGGPTSYRANIGYSNDFTGKKDKDKIRREYNLAFADFAILYNADLRPVNPPSRTDDVALPNVVIGSLKPKPEGISSEDPGTRLLNYRNEPVPLRVAEEDKNIDSLQYHQKTGIQGDIANLFSSIVHRNSTSEKDKISVKQVAEERLKKLQHAESYAVTDSTELLKILENTEQKRRNFKQHLSIDEPWRDDGDPSTPILAAYEGDPLQLHLIQGAQEEQHVFSMNGMKWLAEPHSKDSGYMNGQQIGISEHFEFNVDIPSTPFATTDHLFSSPSVENYWDGMWGLLRSHGWKDTGITNEPNTIKELARLPETPTLELPGGDAARVCSVEALKKAKTVYVSAWLASDILAKRGKGKQTLTYNQRFDITDPNAIVFLKLPSEWVPGNKIDNWPKADYLLQQFQDLYGLSAANQPLKELEPLVLRVAAGDCVNVFLKSYLPETFEDSKNSLNLDTWSYNLMPPIVSGFNFNQLQMSSNVGLTPQLLAYDVHAKEGVIVGLNIDPSKRSPAIVKGCRKVKNRSADFSSCDGPNRAEYLWYAGDRKITPQNASYTPIEFGIAGLRDFNDVIKHTSHGAIGAIVVEPEQSHWSTIDNPDLDERCAAASKRPDGTEKWPKTWCRSEMMADVCVDSDASTTCQVNSKTDIKRAKTFREFVLLVQDDLSLQQQGQPMPNHRMADDAEDTGQKGFNYRSEPLWARNGIGTSGADFNELNRVDYKDTLSSFKNIAPCKQTCEPETPIFKAPAGSQVRFRILHPGGHSRQHAFVLHGHNWDYQPWIKNSTQLWDGEGIENDKPLTARVGAIGGIGPGRHLNILTKAGGALEVKGDYLFRVQEQFQFQGGMWGIFRVE